MTWAIAIAAGLAAGITAAAAWWVWRVGSSADHGFYPPPKGAK